MATKRETIDHVDPATLIRNKQVRKDRNETADKELVASIKRHGVLQPIQVRLVGKDFHVVAGHRRTEAAIAAGATSVPVYIAEVADNDVLSRQMIENIQREGLSLADTAAGVRALHEGPGGGLASYTAERLGKSPAWVSKMLLVAGGDEITPGSIARKLVQTDKVGDLESAYLLCRLEEKNPEAAKEVAINIANETRSSIKKKLQSVKRAKPEAQPEEETEDVDYAPVYKWLLKVAKAASVSARDLPIQEQAIAMIVDMQSGE